MGKTLVEMMQAEIDEARRWLQWVINIARAGDMRTLASTVDAADEWLHGDESEIALQWAGSGAEEVLYADDDDCAGCRYGSCDTWPCDGVPLGAMRETMEDDGWPARRAAAFQRHCDQLHNADFEVCNDVQCHSVVEEEVRRGLLDAGSAWPPVNIGIVHSEQEEEGVR